VTVADQHLYPAGAAAGTSGSRAGGPQHGERASHSGDTFHNLLFQDQADPNENPASASSRGTEPNGSGAGTSPETAVKRSFSARSCALSSETQTSPRRKELAGESNAAAPASVAQPLDLSTAARWLLSLTAGNASATSTTTSSLPDPDGQSPAGFSAQLSAAAVPTQEERTSPGHAVLLDSMANPLEGAGNAISGATPGSLDAAPFAELSLTPVASSATPTLATSPKLNSPLTTSPVDSLSISRHPTSDLGSQSQGVTAREAVPEIGSSVLDHGGESSLNQSAGRQQEVPATSKKKAEAGGAQFADANALADRGGAERGETASPVATPSSESLKSRNSTAPPTPASPVQEPTPPAPVKPFGSSVGTIELQVRGANEQQVGLRFVERQGHVEIQLKSGDAQAAQTLSDSLAGLKTSLNENGWDVESRIQTRLSVVNQGPQAESSADRRFFPLAQFESSSLAAHGSLDPASTTGDQQIRGGADQPGAPRSPRPESVSTAQLNHQGGSDSPSGQDQSRPDRDGSSGRNGQHARNDSAGGDAERQGRRPARDSEAWLESIESNLTRASSRGATTGATK
jgi:hypothetical protein